MESLTIGRLSKRSGTPVKTIRYYDEAGVLKPSAVSDAGYRLYSEKDAARLESIRALRELGFPLAAIRVMLAGKRDPHEIVQVQLKVIESQMRALRRQRAILETVLAQRDADVLHALHLSHAAASLGAAERISKIEAFMQRAAGQTDDANARRLRDMVLKDLPEDLTPEQLEAWLQLSALLDDGKLLQTIQKQYEPFSGPVRDQAKFGSAVFDVLCKALGFLEENRAADDPEVRRLANRWCKLFAEAMGKRDDAKFRRWFKRYAEETNDPRIERFWHLVSVLHGRPAAPPFTRAQALLIEAL
jgi:DNA-binding transcriptional MerR regulator